MNEIFLLFFSLSLSGAFISLLLILLKPIYKNKLSKKWQYYIWIIILIRLIIPIAPFNNIIGNLFTYADDYFTAKSSITESKEDIYDYNQYDEYKYHNNSENLELNIKYNNINLNKIFKFIKNYVWVFWIFISIILLIQRIVSYKNFIKFIKAGSLKLNDSIVMDIYNNICYDMKIKNKPDIYINNIVISPMLAGFLKPFIVIPKKNIEKENIRYILMHELIHYKRKDIFYKWFVQLIICIHWYNPFVYILCNEVNKNCELSCDEEIIKNLNIEQRKQYGDTLLASVLNDGTYSDSFVSITLNENVKLLKERLGAIMKFNNNRNIIMSIALIVLIAVSALVSGCIVIADDYKYEEKVGYFSSDYVTYRNSYYENNYIINIEWSNSYKKYDDKIKTEININGQSFIIYFSQNVKNYMNNNDIINALKSILLEEYNRNKFNYILIDDILGPYNMSKEELGEKFYSQKNIAYFSVVTKKADRKWKADYAKKAYEDREVAFFSILSDSMNEKEIIEIAHRAYKDKEIAFFSIIADSIPDYEKVKLAEKAYKDGEIAFFSIISEDKNYYRDKYGNKSFEKENNKYNVSELDNEKAKLAIRAYEDREIAFFGSLSEYLSDTQKVELAIRAYEDGEIAFFGSLSEYLSDTQKAELAIRAYEDGEIAFFGSLLEYLSDTQKAELAIRAYEDGEIAFFGSLSEYLSDTQKAELVIKAYEDRKIAFFNMLSD